MDLTTSYLGLKLAHPIVPGASPLTAGLDSIRRLEDAGAPAVVLPSLFEEQISGDLGAVARHEAATCALSPEASSFFPSLDQYRLGPEEYLEHLRKVKAAVRIPVIASLNGTRTGGWLRHAKLMEQAGADAIELNFYHVAADAGRRSEQLESDLIAVVLAVRSSTRIPFSVKLSPDFSCLSNFAARIEEAGANGLVLFNRFYQPDINLEELTVTQTLELSTPAELRLRLRWLAILSSQRKLDLACTGGVHSAADVARAILAGASTVQIASALLKDRPVNLAEMALWLGRWMTDREYASTAEMRGALNLSNCPDPAAFERGNYLRILQLWKG